MNILMLGGHFYPRMGGVEKHLLRVSEELVKSGHRVTVLTRRWQQGWPAEETVRGIRVRRLAGGMSKAFRDRALDLFREADVVHCHDHYSYLRFAAPAWPRVKAPLFVTFHGYEGYPVPRTARWLRRKLAARAAGTICMGEFICRWYGHRCDVVSYGGVDAPFAPPPDAAPDAPALYFGRLAADTGIMDYVKALGILRQRGCDLSLVVCGDGPLQEQVMESAREAGVNVTMRGWTDNVAGALDQCRFAFISGYLSILEAMAHRRPVCSLYDNPLKRDYLQLHPAARNMIIANGAESLATAIMDRMENPAKTAEMVLAAEVYARRQTWAEVARIYLNLYRSRGLHT